MSWKNKLSKKHFNLFRWRLNWSLYYQKRRKVANYVYSVLRKTNKIISLRNIHSFYLMNRKILRTLYGDVTNVELSRLHKRAFKKSKFRLGFHGFFFSLERRCCSILFQVRVVPQIARMKQLVLHRHLYINGLLRAGYSSVVRPLDFIHLKISLWSQEVHNIWQGQSLLKEKSEFEFLSNLDFNQHLFERSTLFFVQQLLRDTRLLARSRRRVSMVRVQHLFLKSKISNFNEIFSIFFFLANCLLDTYFLMYKKIILKVLIYALQVFRQIKAVLSSTFNGSNNNTGSIYISDKLLLSIFHSNLWYLDSSVIGISKSVISSGFINKQSDLFKVTVESLILMDNDTKFFMLVRLLYFIFVKRFVYRFDKCFPVSV